MLQSAPNYWRAYFYYYFCQNTNKRQIFLERTIQQYTSICYMNTNPSAEKALKRLRNYQTALLA